MKKVMLFIATMLFAIAANSASITVNNAIIDGASLSGIAPNNSDTVFATYVTDKGIYGDGGYYMIGNDVTSDVDTRVKVTWTFNDPNTFSSAAITQGEDSYLNGFQTDIFGAYTFYTSLLAGVTQYFDIEGLSKGVMSAQLSVSAVPVPSAVFLFAPAFLGLFGLRRKATALEA